jgi:NADPH:quinone reductase-like Zn-dependent oxidoreductase
LSELEPTIAFDSLGDGFVAPVLQSLAPRGRLVSSGTSAGAEVELNMQTVYAR